MKTLIIDLDGTLVDSMGIWDVLAIHYLQSLNIKIEDYLSEKLKTMSLKEAALYIQKEYAIPKTIEDIQKDFMQQLWIEYENVPLKQGVEQFLKICHAYQKEIIIFTANDYFLTLHLCQRLQINQWIDHIMTCQEIGYDKNDSQSYHRVIEKYQLNPNDCLVIEDAYHALKSAKESGLKAWAVYDKSNQNEWEKICEIADKYFMTFNEMEVIR